MRKYICRDCLREFNDENDLVSPYGLCEDCMGEDL